MSERIKSYKLSPQLRAEIGYGQKNTATKINFQINWSKIPVKSIAVGTLTICLALGAYVGIKKCYQSLAYKKQQKAIVVQQENENRLANVKQEIAAKELSATDYVKLSQNCLQDGDTEKAQIAAELAIEKDGNWRDGYINLGQIYLSTNKFDLARETLQKAIAIDPIYGNAQYLLYLTCQELKDQNGAKEALAKAKKFGFNLEVGG